MTDPIEIVERFEKAVIANGYRTRDDMTEKEYDDARMALIRLVLGDQYPASTAEAGAE